MAIDKPDFSMAISLQEVDASALTVSEAIAGQQLLIYEKDDGSFLIYQSKPNDIGTVVEIPLGVIPPDDLIERVTWAIDQIEN